MKKCFLKKVSALVINFKFYHNRSNIILFLILTKAGKIKKKTPVTHFFDSITNFTSQPSPNLNIKFYCKLESCRHNKEPLLAPLSELSNLNKHVNLHSKEYDNWYSKYIGARGVTKENIIPPKRFSLILYYITSNTALKELENPNLVNALDPSIKCIKTDSFRNTILPDILKKLKNAFSIKLKSAVTVSLIVDIWTNAMNSSYLALGAAITNISLEREVMVIGMIKMEDEHSAENVKKAIEAIINPLDFNVEKIHGNTKILF